MADKKIIAVVGATGAQGGGLVRAIQGDESGGFFARALTRDVHSDKAKELAGLGPEVVAADVDDVESLKRAFKGAYGAFCVTFALNAAEPRVKASVVCVTPLNIWGPKEMAVISPFNFARGIGKRPCLGHLK